MQRDYLETLQRRRASQDPPRDKWITPLLDWQVCALSGLFVVFWGGGGRVGCQAFLVRSWHAAGPGKHVCGDDRKEYACQGRGNRLVVIRCSVAGVTPPTPTHNTATVSAATPQPPPYTTPTQTLHTQSISGAFDPDQSRTEDAMADEALTNKEESREALSFVGRLVVIPLITGALISRAITDPVLSFSLQVIGCGLRKGGGGVGLSRHALCRVYWPPRLD